MGQSGVDVPLIGIALERMPLSIECKNQEKWSIHEWIKQAQDNKKEDTDWVLVCKRNQKDPVVVISDDYFWKLQEIVLNYKERNDKV